MQITRKSVCRKIRNLAPFFVTPSRTPLVDMLDVLRLRARCSQAMSNLQILDIFGPRHALNKGTCTKRRTGASSTYFSMWVGHTHLKILHTMPKTHPHQERFENNCVGDNFLPDNTVLGGQLAVRRPCFFKTSIIDLRELCPSWEAYNFSSKIDNYLYRPN